MPDSTRTDPPEDPEDRVTDALRGIVAREADAAREQAARTAPRVRYVGDYQLLEEIARGGMGVVYRARQLTLNREVALKMILAGQLADEAAVERFQAEAEAAANLRHPSIVPIYEIGEHEGQHYFSMELVEGRSLADLVREGPLPARRAAGYVRAVAEAIHYAHQEGTLHRDLKPSNVLVDRDDQPRITDFGLAKRIEGPSRTASGDVMGTPSYMPPEQAAGKRALIGPASDVYSLGALLYELVTGRPPFRADNAVNTLKQVLESEPAPPRVVNPTVPVELDTICLECLEKLPENRYRTAQELADDLGRFLDREPILARPAGRLRKGWSWARRHPWSVTMAAVVLAIAAMGVAYWLWVERALWQHMAAHPDYVRESGERAERLEELSERNWSVFYVLIVLQFLTTGSYPWIRRLHRAPYFLPIVGVLAVVASAFGFQLALAVTEAHVWEGSFARTSAFVALVLVLIGANVVARAFYAHEGQIRGAALELTEEQEDELYELLSEGPKADFKKRLRLARERYLDWTGADPVHVNQVLRRMWGELRSAYPDRVPSKHTLVKVVFVLLVFVGAVAFAH